MLGGGMRQAGVLAAAGIVALTQMVDRLAEDHENAAHLAEAIASIGYGLDLATVETNIVIFDVSPLSLNIEEFVEDLKARGVKASQFGATKVRMVTHHGISRDDVDYAISVLTELAK
jgi:threonine aldolase